MFFKVVIVTGTHLTVINATQETIRDDSVVSHMLRVVQALEIGDQTFNADHTIVIIRVS